MIRIDMTILQNHIGKQVSCAALKDLRDTLAAQCRKIESFYNEELEPAKSEIPKLGKDSKGPS